MGGILICPGSSESEVDESEILETKVKVKIEKKVKLIKRIIVWIRKRIGNGANGDGHWSLR